MSFKIKSKENLDLAEKCLGENKYINAITSRIYYAVFLRIKGYLIGINFDYKDFVSKYYPNQDEYSHGTIKSAIQWAIQCQSRTTSIKSVFTQLDRLYEFRVNADYWPIIISPEKLNDCVKSAKIMISTIDNLENGVIDD